MIKTINKKIILSLSLMLIILNFSSLASFCQEEDEDQPTQVNQIAPENPDNLNNRTYDEGVTVKEVEIKGNNLVKTDDILNKLSTKKGTRFDRNTVQKDLKTIYDMGYFTDKIRAVPEASNTGIKLRIELEENTPVTGFNITGNKVLSTGDLAKIFNSQTGLPQNIAELNKAVEKIENLYAEKGYILARVKKITDDPDGMINIQINEGTIDDIKISGNTKTKDFVIKRNMLTVPNTVYNENILKQDLSRIFSTQAFSDVRRVISASAKDPDKYQLTVEVDEKRTASVSLGGGVDTTSGLFGSLGYADNNFRGLGQQLSTNLTVGSGIITKSNDIVRKPALQLEANFVEPRLKQTLNSLEFSAFGREYGSYQVPLGIEKRIGSEIELSRPLKSISPHLAGSVSLGVENVRMEENNYDDIRAYFSSPNNPADIAARAKQMQGGTFLSFGPSLVFDTRNNMLNPTSGLYASTSVKESFMLNGSANTFGKVTAGIQKFIPVGQKSTLVFGGKMGTQLISNLPEFATFRLGGSNTIRGFREGDVGNGPGFMLASTEFRTPIPFIDKITNINFFRDIRTAFFMDAGTILGEKSITDQWFHKPGYGVSAGMGLRVNVPGLGPIRVDYGYPLTFLGKGNNRVGRFTFGFGEKY